MPRVTCPKCGTKIKLKKKAEPDVHAKAFLGMARQYHEVAEELFAARKRRESSGGQRAITDDPIYFLYYHTIELAFKAYLRAHDRPIQKTHELTELYEDCQTLGLVIEPDERFQIKGLVSLLESGEEYLRFRYFNPNSMSQPDLAWTREGVDAVMQNVSDQMPVGSILPKGGKMIVSWSKLYKKDESKPGKIDFTVGKVIPKKDDSKI